MPTGQLESVPALPHDRLDTPEHAVRRLGLADTARVLATVVAPTLAVGVIKRRPRLMRLTERLGLTRMAVTTMRGLRDRLGSAPVALGLPGRSFVFPLSETDAGRVLAGTPDPFTPATVEKRAALLHFQPHGVLVSRGVERAERRRFNERVLLPEHALHPLAPHIVDIVREQTDALLRHEELTWDEFNRHWWAAVRRIVLGERARHDDELTDLLATLRAAGNWAFLHPRRRGDRKRFLTQVAGYVRAAEPNSLAALVHATPGAGNVDPAGQVPHWLFAFDAAGMTTFRTLAVLARHPDKATTARQELDGLDLTRPRPLPYLRACVLDTVRLWPTTPALLREVAHDTGWGPKGTTTFLYTPFFHRDPETLPGADVFTPEIWLDGTAAGHPALTPFSAGPGQCPGRNIVLLTTSTMLAGVLAGHDVTLLGKPAIDPHRPLPATLDNFSTTLRITPRTG
jgi:cytochrome P450